MPNVPEECKRLGYCNQPQPDYPVEHVERLIETVRMKSFIIPIQKFKFKCLFNKEFLHVKSSKRWDYVYVLVKVLYQPYSTNLTAKNVAR